MDYGADGVLEWCRREERLRLPTDASVPSTAFRALMYPAMTSAASAI